MSETTSPDEAPRVVVHVDRQGTVRAETLGVTGPDCLDYVAVLEDLLDATTVHSATTADYDRGVATDRSSELRLGRGVSQTDGGDELPAH